MLEIEVVTDENFDETTKKFVVAKSVKVRLEHSLVSLSKWESVWEEVFLSEKEKTREQTVSYVQMMILNDDLPPEIFRTLIEKHLDEVNKYITANMSATKIHSDKNAPHSREVITAELIYYWMISMNIPVKFEHWHLNRLLTLIKVINLKSTPQKPMSAMERKNLNRARLAKYGTRG